MARITEGRIAAAEKLAKGSPAAGGSGPLSAAERAELVRLLGPRPDFDTMTDTDVDQWLHENSIDGDPHPERTDRIVELQRRESLAQAEERLGYPPWQPCQDLIPG